MSASAHIYTGPWLSYSHNSTVTGATLTLSTRNGGYLVAFLALVVATAGTAVWSILSYVLHQVMAMTRSQDAIFRQQQAILKNSQTSLHAAWKFTQVSFSWRNHELSGWRRAQSLLFILLSISMAALFGIATVFSSQVTKAAGNEFLLEGSGCGFWQFNRSANTGFQLKVLNDSLAAASYARECYGIGIKDNLRCNNYKVPEIKFTSTQNATCPFASGTCGYSDTAAYQVDTGLLDSYTAFGINSKRSERVQTRKVVTCAPIRYTPYQELLNVTAPSSSVVEKVLRLNMGKSASGNYSFQYNLWESTLPLGYRLE
jgi:hypothetical protein